MLGMYVVRMTLKKRSLRKNNSLSVRDRHTETPSTRTEENKQLQVEKVMVLLCITRRGDPSGRPFIGPAIKRKHRLEF